MKYNSLAAAITLGLTTSPVWADEQPPEDQSIERLVIVSSRVAMPIREVATSVTVVNKADIEARGHANLAQVLQSLPSIGVTNSGGAGSPTSLRVRGEEGYRTLVRIDGVDISDPTAPQVQPQFAHLQSANVARVEILRGSQGLAYGADAGGVINIQSTQYSDPLAGSVSAEYGRYATHNLSADLGGNHKKFDYYVAISDYNTEGFNSRVDDLSQDKDGYQNTTVHSRLGYQVNDALTLSLVARHNEGEGQFDNCGFAATASNLCQSEFEQSNVRAQASYVLAASEHELAYAKTSVTKENFNQGVSSFLTEGTIERVEYLAHSDLNADTRLVYGLDWEQESITTEKQSRNNTGLYFEYQSEIARDFFITAGVRRDDNDDFGQHTSYRLSAAYIWSLGDNELKLRSAYGTGFRAPSLFEIEYNRGPFAFPPAATTELKEEKTKGYEIALEYSTHSNSHFAVVYFDQKIDDSIFFDLTGFSGYLQDPGQSKSQGVELIADVKLSQAWGLDFNYTYNETSDTAGNQRIRRPRQITNLGFYYQADKLTVSANMRVIQDFVDSAAALDDYQLFDLSARYQINQQLVVFARIENLLDEDYQDIVGFNTAAAGPHIGLKYQF